MGLGTSFSREIRKLRCEIIIWIANAWLHTKSGILHWNLADFTTGKLITGILTIVRKHTYLKNTGLLPPAVPFDEKEVLQSEEVGS